MTAAKAVAAGATGPPEAEQSRSVYERVCAIVAEMPAIGKGQKNTQQGFMYRGHDDVMNELNPLLSKHGVFFVPNVIERITDQRTTGAGKVMYEVNLLVEYTFYGADGDSFIASAWGEGTDSGDKSTNKAMTMALKNVLAQTFAVSTQEMASHDTDGGTPEETTGRRSSAPKQPETTDGVALIAGAPLGWTAIMKALKQLDPEMPWKEWVAQAAVERTGKAAFTDLDDQEKIDLGIRVANGVVHLLAAHGGRDFPPLNRAEVQTAFGFADSVDVKLAGPDVPLDPAEAAERDAKELPIEEATGDAGTQEEASDAPLGPSPKGTSDDIPFGEKAK